MTTSYSVPDITGKNPNYLQVNLPFYIYENNIKLAFENSPVFLSSIRIVTADGSSTILQKDVHWTVDPASDIDHTAMSKAFVEKPDFDEVLVRSVTLTSPAMVKKLVTYNVQQFYDTLPGRFFDDGAPLQLTPAVIKSLITSQAYIRQQMARVQSPVTPNNHAPTLLKFDINAEFAANNVKGETLTVNTVGGGNIIRLAQGAFFADSVVIKKNGVSLDPTTDYLPVMVSPLNKQTTNKSGIYNYILIAKELTGDIVIDYHALGGDVQQNDISALYDLSISLKTFLDEQIFLTSETISETPAFKAIHARVQSMETNMRNLLSGAPTYGDATGNQAVRRPISAPDAKLHWYTIANLFRVTGSTDVILADQFKGRVFFPGAKVALSFTVDVNLNQVRNPVTFTTNNVVFDPLYTLFTDISTDAPVYPLLRVVWNRLSDGMSGLSLQVGIALTAGSDQMVVEDMSTQESCWLLDKTGQQITGNTPVTPSAPKDNGFTLPDGQAVWSSASASARSRVHVPAYRDGYLVYSGSTVNLTNLRSDNSDKPALPATSTKNLFNVVLPTYFPLDNMRQLLVTMASSDGTSIYDVEFDLSLIVAGTKFGKRSFTDSTGNRYNFSATVVQDAGGAITVSLNITNTGNTPTDVVRYIRARV